MRESKFTPDDDLIKNKERTASIILDEEQEENLEAYGAVKCFVLKDEEAPGVGTIVSARNIKGKNLGNLVVRLKEDAKDAKDENVYVLVDPRRIKVI